MSRFNAQYDRAAALLTEQLGQPIAYRDEDGEDQACEAIVEAEQVAEEDDADHGREFRRTRMAAIYRITAQPKIHGIFTVGGVEYVIDEISSENTQFTTVRGVRLVTHERTRSGYRKG
jgi:3-methyladenine DNA glycosylase Mpg